MRYSFKKEIAVAVFNKGMSGRFITRDGKDALIISFDSRCDFPILGIVIDDNGTQRVIRYTDNGKVAPNRKDPDDLFIITDDTFTSDRMPYVHGDENKKNLSIIDKSYFEVEIIRYDIFRNDIVNGRNKHNMLYLAKTEEGLVPDVCDRDGFRDGNRVLYTIKKNR